MRDYHLHKNTGQQWYALSGMGFSVNVGRLVGAHSVFVRVKTPVGKDSANGTSFPAKAQKDRPKLSIAMKKWYKNLLVILVKRK